VYFLAHLSLGFQILKRIINPIEIVKKIGNYGIQDWLLVLKIKWTGSILGKLSES